MTLLNSITKLGLIAWLSICAILIQPAFALPVNTGGTSVTAVPVPVTKVPTIRATATRTRAPVRTATPTRTKTPVAKPPTLVATIRPTIRPTITPTIPQPSPPDDGEICEDDFALLADPIDSLPTAPVNSTRGTFFFAPSGPIGGSCLSPAALEKLIQGMFRSAVLAQKHFETRWIDPITNQQILSCTTPVEPVAAKRSAPSSRLVEAMINTSKICTKMSNLVATASDDEIQCLDDDQVGPPAPKKTMCCACIYARDGGPFGNPPNTGNHDKRICEEYVRNPKMWEPEKCDHVNLFPIKNDKGEADGLEQWLTSRNPACTDVRMVTYGHSNAPFVDERQLPTVRCIEQGGKTLCSLSHQDCGCSSFGDCNLVKKVAQNIQNKLKAANCNAWIEFNGSPRPQHLPVRLPGSKVCWKNPNGFCNDEYDWLKVMIHKNYIAYYKYDVKSGKWIKVTEAQFNSYCSSRRRPGPPVSGGGR